MVAELWSSDTAEKLPSALDMSSSIPSMALSPPSAGGAKRPPSALKTSPPKALDLERKAAGPFSIGALDGGEGSGESPPRSKVRIVLPGGHTSEGLTVDQLRTQIAETSAGLHEIPRSSWVP